MRKLHKLFCVFALALTLPTVKSSAQVLMEDYNYSPVTPLTAHGYMVIDEEGINPIMVTTQGLSYPGSSASGVAFAATLTTSGEDLTKLVAPFINSGNAYASFLVNVTSAQLAGDYFFSLYDDEGYKARVWIKSSASGFVFGISKNSSTASYESTQRSFNTTYLVVLKYTFNTGTTTDDAVSFYVNPILGGPEPAATIPATTSGNAGDATIIDRIALRQGSLSSAPGLVIDGIRVGTTWASVTRLGYPFISSLSPKDARVGSPGFTLTVNGPNFATNAVIYWNGIAKTTTFVNSTQLTAIIESTELSSIGTIPVQIGTPGGELSNSTDFIIYSASGGVIHLSSPPPYFGFVCPNPNISMVQSFTLEGHDLDGSNNSTITLTQPPPGFHLSISGSTDNTSFTYSGNSFSGKVIDVIFQPYTEGPYGGTILINGGGVTNFPVSFFGISQNSPPSVTTYTASAVGTTTATVGGAVNSEGCSSVTARGVEYSTTSGFANGNGTSVAATNLSGAVFSVSLSGLSPNTKYYYRAYATNSAGTSYGSEQAFINLPEKVRIASQPQLTFKEDFSDIANWTGFSSGSGANHFGGVSSNTATGGATLPDPTKLTTSTSTFQTSLSSGGVQKGTDQTIPTTSLVLLSTGDIDNTSSAGIDFYVDFTGVNAGTLSFDYQTISNDLNPGGRMESLSAGDRAGSLIVYASIDGINWTELTNVLNFTNNNSISGSKINIALPSSFNNNANTRLRFYYYNGSGGSIGPRPKIAIDNLTITANADSPLPVKLETFNARQQNSSVVVSWKTSQEINTKEFWVERSENTSTFNIIGKVVAKGNATSASLYQFNDAAPSHGDNYYRLRSVDNDGKWQLSNVVKINLEKVFSLVISPNPASNFVDLKLTNRSEKLVLEITDMYGKIVTKQNLVSDSTKLDISMLRTGFYIVRILGNNSSYTHKLIVE